MKKNNRATIIQQSFNNEKVIKHTNETRQYNTAMKNNIRTTVKPTKKNKNEKTKIVQQTYNNRSTMKK